MNVLLHPPPQPLCSDLHVLQPTALSGLSLRHSTPPQKLLWEFSAGLPFSCGWEKNLFCKFFAHLLIFFSFPISNPHQSNGTSMHIPLPSASVVYPRLIAAFISPINLAVRLRLVDWADKMCLLLGAWKEFVPQHYTAVFGVEGLHPRRSDPSLAARREVGLEGKAMEIHLALPAYGWAWLLFCNLIDKDQLLFSVCMA